LPALSMLLSPQYHGNRSWHALHPEARKADTQLPANRSNGVHGPEPTINDLDEHVGRSSGRRLRGRHVSELDPLAARPAAPA